MTHLYNKQLLGRSILVVAFALFPVAVSAQPKIDPDSESLTHDLSELPKVFSKIRPETLQDLRDIQDRAREVAERVKRATVGVRIGAGQGSGVIISEDGYVLTAAHVSGRAGQTVTLIMHDGKKIRGKTLGANKRSDGGLIKITDKGKWPFAEWGTSDDVKRGQWCLSLGHPRGYKSGRPPVLRLGRIQDSFGSLIRSDCTLVGGDSGGPLFDMNGKVIGIHSRIGPNISYNIHVPIDRFGKDWERMAKGEVFPNDSRAYIGIKGDPDGKDCKILEVYPKSPAEKAGLKEGDIITEFAGKAIDNFEDLVAATERVRPGQVVTVEVLRNNKTLSLKLKLGKR